MTKQRNGKIKTLIAIVGIIIVLAGVVMSIAKTYFVLPIEIEHHAKNFTELKETNKEKHDELQTDIDSCQDWMGETKAELVGIKKDVEYLGKKVDRSLDVQQEILTEIREINK